MSFHFHPGNKSIRSPIPDQGTWPLSPPLQRWTDLGTQVVLSTFDSVTFSVHYSNGPTSHLTILPIQIQDIVVWQLNVIWIADLIVHYLNVHIISQTIRSADNLVSYSDDYSTTFYHPTSLLFRLWLFWVIICLFTTILKNCIMSNACKTSSIRF